MLQAINSDFKGVKRVKRLDNPLSIQLRVKSYVEFARCLTKFMKVNSLTFEMFRDLSTICSYYMEFETGVGSARILKLNELTVCGSMTRSLQFRLKWLKERDLISNEGYIYYPTDKALEVMKELI